MSGNRMSVGACWYTNTDWRPDTIFSQLDTKPAFVLDVEGGCIPLHTEGDEQGLRVIA